MTPSHRARRARGRSLVGERFTADVGPVAHGGHFVARVPIGDDAATRVVFVRHTLPGETVLLEVTDGTEGDRFLRADAVEVLSASPDRVAPPCPFAGPALCGGCDFQHVALPAQRALKAQVVREQLSRLAGLDVDVEVEAVSGDEGGLRWRTRVQWARMPDGRRGLRRHRSHGVVPVDDCLISHPHARHVLEGEPTGGTVVERVRGHRFNVAADGFWQVHPGAPDVLVETVLELARPRAGERVLDLYAGVGLFSVFLAEAVGPDGRVTAVESDRVAAGHAGTNLAAYTRADAVCARVDRWLRRADATADLVVLDPPREGAKQEVVEQVTRRRPRAVVYVACDPAALARDTAYLAASGYRLVTLRAFDLFPMTHHVECVALFQPEPDGPVEVAQAGPG